MDTFTLSGNPSIIVGTLYSYFTLTIAAWLLGMTISVKDQRKELPFFSAINVLKYISYVYNSILLIPILSTLIGILNCKNNYNIQDFCNETSFFIAQIFSIVFVIPLVGLIVIFALFLFDTTDVYSSKLSKRHVYLDVSLVVIKTLLVIVLEVIPERFDKSGFITSFLLFLISLVPLLIFKLYQPFYFTPTMRVYRVKLEIFVFSAFIVIIQKTIVLFDIELYVFQQLFFLGCSFILLIELCSKVDKTQILPETLDSFKYGSQAEMQISFFVNLFRNKTVNYSEVLLKGHIIHHEMECEQRECFLKDYKDKFLYDLGENRNEGFRVLRFHCCRLFERAISRFPKDIMLRIQYAAYLIEIMNRFNKAKMQLKLIEQEGISLPHQFVCYRLMRALTYKITMRKNNESGADLNTPILFEEFSKDLNEKIEATARDYLDFWNTIAHEDISKLT